MKAVVFDMDGVLFDTERISCESCFQAVEELGLSVSPEVIYGCFGRNAADCRAFVMERMEAQYPGGTFPYEAYRKRHDELCAKRREDGVPVMPGARELLDFLKENKIPMALASGTRRARVMENLEETGFAGYFDAIIAGDMVERSKPAPDIYLKACSALGVAPCDAMAVEDSPNGIRSAAAAGMLAAMVPDLVQPDEEIRGLLDLCVPSLTALRDWIAQRLEEGRGEQ